ncbi:MAG: Crp/Fnr family transcriptional regulator [Sphingomonadales bacterium]|nr:Crp/Fnr family transcriptional regulator [Sphingomonadales bacterium]
MNAVPNTCEQLSETEHFRRHQHLTRAGDSPRVIWQLEEGWACRYRMLSGARRQITGLFLPGEFCEPQWLLGERPRHAIVALTPLRARGVPLDAPGGRSATAQALVAATLRTLARQSDWIVALGRQNAVERMCTLLDDLFDRLRDAGQVREDKCLLPLTQADLADVVGLTPVHVNRVLKMLRAQGVIEKDGAWLRVPDGERLRRLAAGGGATPTGRKAMAADRLGVPA